MIKDRAGERRKKKTPGSFSKENKDHVLTAPNETYDYVDIDLCRPHPTVFGLRFEYKSESLEQSIRGSGQLEPCRAIRDEEDKTRLLVYIGQRRLNAVRNLQSKYAVPLAIKVIIDEDDIPGEELVKRSLAENMDENGQRLPLSDLEKIVYCRHFLREYGEEKAEKILINAGFEQGKARKIVYLVDKFDKEKIGRLHEIESKSNFRFKIAHLDMLLNSEDEENFYRTASIAAFSQKPPEEIKILSKASRIFSQNIPWFNEIFPEFALGEIHEDKTSPDGKMTSDAESEVPNLEVYKESYSYPTGNDEMTTGSSLVALSGSLILIPCHYCKSINLLKLRAVYPEFIFCSLKEEGFLEQLVIEANTLFDCERECQICKKSFWVTASLLDGGKIVIEISRSRIIAVPKKEALVRMVYWNNKDGRWMLYDEIAKKKYDFDNSKALELFELNSDELQNYKMRINNPGGIFDE